MKRLVMVPALALLLACSASAQDDDAQAAAGQGFATDKEKASYAVGMNIGTGLKQQAEAIDVELVIAGLRDAFAGGETRMSEAELQQTLSTFQQELMAKEQQKRQAAATENLAKSEEFLAGNKARPEVKTTESGLQYEVIQEGTGASPAATDTVTVHYRGTLADGTVFDSSYDRGQPATFPVNAVIPGWQEAIQMMKVGGKWKLYIPPQLGYGDRGAGPKIGPNQALVFEVELLGIEGGDEE